MKKNLGPTGVYMIMCLRNRKVYIGASSRIRKRWMNHRRYLNTGVHSIRELQEDWRLYGRENFCFSILEELEDPSCELLRERELYWMQHYDCFKVDKGYNRVLPDGTPFHEEDCNKCQYKTCPIISIDTSSRECIKYESIADAVCCLQLKRKFIEMCADYWVPGKKLVRKSHKGKIFVREKDFSENFDYVGYSKPRRPRRL